MPSWSGLKLNVEKFANYNLICIMPKFLRGWDVAGSSLMMKIVNRTSKKPKGFVNFIKKNTRTINTVPERKPLNQHPKVSHLLKNQRKAPQNYKGTIAITIIR